MSEIEKPRFLRPGTAEAIAAACGTPVYVYDEKTLVETAREVLAFPHAFGLTARFAMKALPNGNVLRLFAAEGLHFDCSSGFEAERALAQGIPADRLLVTAQELPRDLKELLRAGVLFNACSARQIEAFAEAGGTELGLRFNPGLGSGGTKRTNVGGPASSFGIWVEHLDEILAQVERLGLRVVRIHTHIGSGSDPEVWQKVAHLSLGIVERFPEAVRLDLGGGFKVGRMANEKTTDLQSVGAPVKKAFEDFAVRTGRKLHLEIEPGTFLVARAGALLARVEDAVDTGDEGYRFLKLDLGMTEVLRPSLYGAQHPISVLPKKRDARPVTAQIVAGHCCESGDILTPSPGDPEALAPRPLLEGRIGDLVVIDGSGAYCAGMSAKNYNSFPEAAEVLLRATGDFTVIRKRQALEQIWTNEVRAV